MDIDSEDLYRLHSAIPHVCYGMAEMCPDQSVFKAIHPSEDVDFLNPVKAILGHAPYFEDEF